MSRWNRVLVSQVCWGFELVGVNQISRHSRDFGAGLWFPPLFLGSVRLQASLIQSKRPRGGCQDKREPIVLTLGCLEVKGGKKRG